MRPPARPLTSCQTSPMASFPVASFAETARATEEIRAVTSDGTETHRTPIWIVVVAGKCYVRSYRAQAGRWYQEALARPEMAIEIAGEDVAVLAVPVGDDEATVAAVSGAYLEKYATAAETPDMVRDEALPTTLELRPIAGSGGAT